MPLPSKERKQRLILALCLVGGVLLTVIGIRFFVTPESAARTFGVPGRPEGYELYTIIGLRNVWLGLLVLTRRRRDDRSWRQIICRRAVRETLPMPIATRHAID